MVVSHPDSPPPSITCEYQVKVAPATYKCFSAQEYQQYKADLDAQATANGQAVAPYMLGFIVALFVVVVVIPSVAWLIGKIR